MATQVSSETSDEMDRAQLKRGWNDGRECALEIRASMGPVSKESADYILRDLLAQQNDPQYLRGFRAAYWMLLNVVHD